MTITYDEVFTLTEEEVFPHIPSDEDWHWYTEVMYVDPAEREDHL